MGQRKLYPQLRLAGKRAELCPHTPPEFGFRFEIRQFEQHSKNFPKNPEQ